MDCKVIVPSIAFCFTGHLRGTKHRLFGLSNGLQPTQPINQSLLIDVATLAMSIFYIHNLKQHVHWSIVVWQRPKRHTKQTPDCVRSWWGGQLFWALPKCCDRTLKNRSHEGHLTHTHTHTHNQLPAIRSPMNAKTQPRHDRCFEKRQWSKWHSNRVILIASINGVWLHHHPQVPNLKVVVVPHSTLENSSKIALFSCIYINIYIHVYIHI